MNSEFAREVFAAESEISTARAGGSPMRLQL
jgi:hypothetical protein